MINPATCVIGNFQLVSLQVLPHRPTEQKVFVQAPACYMSREGALIHAAWLVALAEEKDGQFEEILARVRNT